MKIRNGFVSNSSSSSFVVAFDRKPKSWQEVKDILFGDKEHITIYDMTVSASEAAQQVFKDMKEQTPNQNDEIIETISNGYLDSFDEIYSDYMEWTEEDDTNEFIWRRSRHSVNKKIKFMKENKDKYIYIFQYSDDDGDFGTVMEHYGIFKNLNHLVASHH